MDTQLQLSSWLRNQGLPTRPGHHIPARAQERILSQACEVDARLGNSVRDDGAASGTLH